MSEAKSTFPHEGFLSEEAKTLEETNLSSEPRYLALFKDALLVAHKSFFALRVPSRDHRGLYAACLFVRILEVCQAVVLLSARGLRHDAETLVRASFEALLRLRAACTDEVLFQRVLVGDARKRLTLLRSALSGQEDISPETRKTIENRKREVEDFLEDAQNGPISTQELARDLGQSESYDTLFRFTSQHVHLSAFSVEEYLEIGPSGRPSGLRYEPRHSHTGIHIVAAAETLLDALALTLEQQRLEVPEQAGRIRAELHQLAPAWPGTELDNGGEKCNAE